MSKLEFLNKDNFSDTIKSGIVCIKFTANWCAPCKAMDPMLEEIVENLPVNCKLYKLDVDDAHDIAAELKIKTIPTLIVFKDGKPYKVQVGRTTKEAVLKLSE